MPPTRHFRLSPLYALLAAFILLATAYSLIIPIFEGPDEDDHFRYARFLAQSRGLPVQPFEQGGGAAGHQGWQPPLYYGLASFLIAPVDTSDYDQHRWRNEAATFVGDPACCGRNIYYHTSSEDWPFKGTTLAVHLARFLTILFGAVTVWAIYALVRAVVPARRLLALVAAAVAGFNPSFLFSSALVSNDVPLAAFASLVLLFLVKWIRDDWALSGRQGALMGLLLGFAVLTKTTALGLVPFALATLVIVGRRDSKRSPAFAAALGLFVVFVALTGWWFVRNLMLYGDPFAYRLMTQSAIFTRSGPLTVTELVQISLPWLWQTFWGGPTPGDFAPSLLILLAVLAGVGIIGCAIWFAKCARSRDRVTFLILSGWLTFLLIAQVQFIRTTAGADQGRYLFPALAVIALLWVTGWDMLTGLIGPRMQMVVGRLAMAAVLGLAIYVPMAYTVPAYARPAPVPADQVERIPNRSDANFSGQVQLLGYELGASSTRPGARLPLTLYWRALAPMNESYRIFVHLVGIDGRTGGGTDVIPGRGSNPTVYWQPGEVIRDTVEIPVVPDARAGKYSIEVGLYPVGHPNDRLAVVGRDDDRTLTGSTKVVSLNPVVTTPPISTDANFGTIQLKGYAARAGSTTLELSLFWHSRAVVYRDYTVFVHLLDREGKIVSQVDREPQAGNYPTSIWSVGEQIRDDSVLDVDSTELTAYRLEIGMYLPETGERLARLDANGSQIGNSVIVPLQLSGDILK